MAVGDYNPFAKRSEFSSRDLITYKILTIASWLLVVVTGIYYTFNVPQDCSRHRHGHYCHTIWGQNDHTRTPFALNSVVVSVYWIVILILQGHYVRYLWSPDTSYVTSAANVGSHFIINNLLTFGFIMLWVRGRFAIAQILLLINLANLTMLYFRHSTTPRFMHIPIVSAPLAWTYIAILWCGAAMVHSDRLVARILANIAIWGILALGAFYLLAFKDYTVGLELALLSLAIALKQIRNHVVALQWIFAFVIMGCLVALSLLVSIPGVLGNGQDLRHEGHIISPDRERRPLLEDA